MQKSGAGFCYFHFATPADKAFFGGIQLPEHWTQNKLGPDHDHVMAASGLCASIMANA